MKEIYSTPTSTSLASKEDILCVAVPGHSKETLKVSFKTQESLGNKILYVRGDASDNDCRYPKAIDREFIIPMSCEIEYATVKHGVLTVKFYRVRPDETKFEVELT